MGSTVYTGSVATGQERIRGEMGVLVHAMNREMLAFEHGSWKRKRVAEGADTGKLTLHLHHRATT